MTGLQQAAALHPGTVQAVARGEVAPAPQRRLRAVESRPRTSRVHVEQVHPLAMAEVRRLLAGSYSRVTLLSPTSVLVQ